MQQTFGACLTMRSHPEKWQFEVASKRNITPLEQNKQMVLKSFVHLYCQYPFLLYL